jgi:rhodanese-related sulfurtransferase
VPFAELAGRWDGYALALSDRPFDIEAIFGPDRQRLMLYGALGVLVLLSVFLLRSRVSRLDWASTRTQRLRLSVGQAGALAFAALASGVVYHVANREGFVANAKTTTLFQEAYRGVFIPRIGVGQVRKLLGTDTLFIDARYREDFDARHLPGAISLPIDVNEATWRKITDPLPKDSQIIVYCQSARCKFAEHAGSQLVKDGFSRVSILRGGWSEWAARNADRVQGRVGKEDGANPNGLPRQSAGAGPGA